MSSTRQFGLNSLAKALLESEKWGDNYKVYIEYQTTLDDKKPALQKLEKSLASEMHIASPDQLLAAMNTYVELRCLKIQDLQNARSMLAEAVQKMLTSCRHELVNAATNDVGRNWAGHLAVFEKAVQLELAPDDTADFAKKLEKQAERTENLEKLIGVKKFCIKMINQVTDATLDDLRLALEKTTGFGDLLHASSQDGMYAKLVEAARKIYQMLLAGDEACTMIESSLHTA